MQFQGTDQYVATDDLKMAVNAAIALKRPLLIKGEPGTGKTLLAEQVAESLGLPLLLFLTALTPAVCEEVFFRGAVLGGLRRDLSRRAAVFWQALIFAVAHASIYRLVPTLWIGLVLGAIRLRSGSLLPAVIVHLGYNAWIVTSGSERAEWLDAEWLGYVGCLGLVLLGMPGRGEEESVPDGRALGDDDSDA